MQKRKRWDATLTHVNDKNIKSVVFEWADIYWILSHSKTFLEQMMKGLVEEAEKWDLEPKPASLCWTGTHADERMDGIKITTTIGVHAMPFEKRFKILGHLFNQA